MQPAHLHPRAFVHAVPSVQSTLCELLSPFDPSGKMQREEVMCSETHSKSVVVGVPSQAHLTSPPQQAPLPPMVPRLKQAPRPVHLRADSQPLQVLPPPAMCQRPSGLTPKPLLRKLLGQPDPHISQCPSCHDRNFSAPLSALHAGGWQSLQGRHSQK